MLNAELIIPGNHNETLAYAANHFIAVCRAAIQEKGAFYVALSGGSTPKAIYELLCSSPFMEEIEWEKIHLFWSDERSVPPEHEESNFHMAMAAGFSRMEIPPAHIHRMVAEKDLEKNALAYEKTIRHVLGDQAFDLVMLGMGDDGHTASLFPETEALHVKGRLVVPNYVPSKNTWRMTLTFEAINAASQTVFYVMGAAKKEMVECIFSTPPTFPCQLVGVVDNPALWIVDREAAGMLSR